MRKFPGEIKRGGGNHHAVILTEEQIEWLRRWYPVTENGRLAKAMGLSIGCVRKYAGLNGITKSEDGMREIWKRQNRAMVRTFNKKGYYDAKRGHAPSAATIEGNRRRWQAIREGKRKDPITTVRESDPERYAALMKHQSDVHKEIVRKEKMRVAYGLERKTSLRIAVVKPYTSSQVAHRHNALVRGYLLDEDCREGQPGRYVIWYDDKTKRNAVFEANCIKIGFEIRKDE